MDGSLKKPADTLTPEEIKKAEDVPLDILVLQEPAIYEKIRDAVYQGSFDAADGYYTDQQSGKRTKSRLDFEIGYKTPLSAGGKTTPDNLQLVYTVPSG